MFHPGKVLRVFRNDEKSVLGFDQAVLAMVQMWDDNLLTVSAEHGLGAKLKEGDVVLLDYSPLHSTLPVPRQVIVKILRGETGKTVWKEYEERHRKSRTETDSPMPLPSHNVR